MSHLHVQQLGHVEQSFLTVQRALQGVLADPTQPGHGRLQAAYRDLETTYVTRLFSQFESILRQYMRTQHPGRRVPHHVVTLINRLALLHGLPDEVRDRAHSVRVYRNSVVHADGATAAAITLRQSTRYLNRFLSSLP